jgi:hypothetical protein
MKATFRNVTGCMLAGDVWERRVRNVCFNESPLLKNPSFCLSRHNAVEAEGILHVALFTKNHDFSCMSPFVKLAFARSPQGDGHFHVAMHRETPFYPPLQGGQIHTPVTPGRLVKTCQEAGCHYFNSTIFFEISEFGVFSL